MLKEIFSGKRVVSISIDEMAVAVQKGESGYIPVLWNKVYRLIDMLAGRFLDECPEHIGQLREDMVNESYFAFLKAVDSFDPERGRFTTYLSWKLKNTFREVVNGGTRRHEPLNEAVSLDTPLNDTDDLTIGESLSEQHSTPHRAILDAEYHRGVSDFLDEAMEHVTDEAGKQLIKFMYVHNCGLTAASRRLYGDDAPVPVYNFNKALEQIRRFARRDSVRAKMDYWGIDDLIGCAGSSLSSFRKRRFTSSVESAAMRREWYMNSIRY